MEDENRDTDAEENERVITPIWDRLTRILHWINALLVLTLILLMFGKEGMEMLGVEKAMRAPVKRLHVYAGYVFILTFLLRVLWGFIGNRYAKWTDMIPFKKEQRTAITANVKWYLGGFKGHGARSTGHDPLASLFYIVLFIVFISQIATGVFLAGIDMKMFPGSLFTASLSTASRDSLKEALEKIHEAGMFYVLFFMAAHMTGLVVHEVKEKNGLFSSMIHGNKYFIKDMDRRG